VLVLLSLLVLVPLVELYVIVEVAGRLGVLETLVLLVATTVGGAWLVKREGLGVARRVQEQMQRGEVPAAEVVDGLLVLAAGVLLLTPGFVTDALGLLLLVPFVRRPLRGLAFRRFRSRLDLVTVSRTRFAPGYGRADVTEARAYERPSRPATSSDRELGAGPDTGTG
jgi:UPF0716 protein FxsA